MKRRICILISFINLLTFSLQAQFTDDFSDGDFTSNPTWSGDVSEFQISTANELQSNGPAANATLHLVTPSTQFQNTIWEFWVKLEFSPSTSNYVQIFLMSDQADLESDLNGYFIRIGESGSSDGIDLFRQDGSSTTKIIDGSNAILTSSSSNEARIRVTRDAAGNWLLEADATGGNTFVQEGTVLDNTITTTSFFGVLCQHSSTRADKFFFDDFSVASSGISLVSATAINSTQIDVLFSEDVDATTAETTTNYSIDNGLGNPTLAQVDGSNGALVHLTYSNIPTGNYVLTANNVAASGNSNVIEANSMANFSFTASIAYKKLVINEIFADFSPQVALPEAEFIEIYNPSSNTINLLNATFTDGSSTATFPNISLASGAYLIACANADTNTFKPFGDVVGLSNFPTLNNGGETLSLKDAFNDLIDEVSYETSWYNDAVKDDGGYTLELINPLDTCLLPENNWSASNDVSGGTPGAENSIFNDTPDTQAPSILSATANTLTEIEIVFNERMDAASLLTANYSITNGSTTINVNQITVSADATTALLVIDPLTLGIFYDLSISNATDCPGNVLGANSNEVGMGKTPSYKELLINEIMADPTPVVGLPDREFIEIYNPTEFAISTNGMYLADAADTVSLPNHTLKPSEYLILTATSGVTDLEPFGTTLGVTSFPSLTNAGEILRLLQPNFSTVDVVVYSEAWYQDEVKEEGGYTLELISPADTCRISDENWIASTNVNGGTPGAQNSVFDNSIDQTVPAILSVQVITADSLLLTFSSKMDVNSLINASYIISDGSNTFNVTGINVLEFGTSATLKVETLTIGEAYTLQITNALGCNQQALPTTAFTFAFGLQPEFHDIIITEIMADPNPVVGLPDVEYIEIYNTTSSYISLKNLILTDLTGSTGFSDVVLEPNGYLLLADDSRIVAFTQTNKLGLASFPSLANSGEPLVLKTTNDKLIFEITYSLDWFEDDAKRGGGFSLEMIDTNQPCIEEANWKGSTSLNGGTPGAANSVTGSVSDNLAPELTRAVPISATEVLLEFNEKLDSASTQTASILIDNGIGITARVFVLPNTKEILLQLDQALDDATTYTVTVNNLQDCSGNLMTVENNYIIHLPQTVEAGDIIINEVVPDAFTGGARYVELYNHSDKYISLKDWQLGVENSAGTIGTNSGQRATLREAEWIMAPNTYLVFTDDINAIANDYPSGQLDLVLEVTTSSFITLDVGDEDKRKIVLIDADGNEMDRLELDESMYFDLLDDVNGVALERISFDAPTNDVNNWASAAESVGFGTPGYLNSQHIDNPKANLGNDCFELSPSVFSPDNDGFEDILTIHYTCNQNNLVATITIYDAQGREFKRLVQNQLLATEGFITWDGVGDSGEKARVGYYILYIESFDLNGNVERIKKTVAVGAKF